jgi:hypothetical protein
MAANELTVRKRVTETLNACAPGTFSEAVDSSHYDRNSQAIKQAIREGALMIANAIVANPRHGHRGLYVNDTPTAFVHGAELPDMAGEMDLVEIQPYNGASWQTGVLRDIQQIESFRLNAYSLYSTIPHDQPDSPLGGYYAIANNKIYFTGKDCRGYFPVIDRDLVIEQIPDEYESTWVALSIGLTPKEGDALFQIAGYFMDIGLRNLQNIAMMGTMQPMPTPDQARKTRGNL